MALHVDYRLALISLALKGKEVSMNKFITMVDDVVVLLKNEQGDDDDNNEMCEKQFDIFDLEKVIDGSNQHIATLTAGCGVD